MDDSALVIELLSEEIAQIHFNVGGWNAKFISNNLLGFGEMELGFFDVVGSEAESTKFIVVQAED